MIPKETSPQPITEGGSELCRERGGTGLAGKTSEECLQRDGEEGELGGWRRMSCPNPGAARTFPSTYTVSPLRTTRFTRPLTFRPAKGVHWAYVPMQG